MHRQLNLSMRKRTPYPGSAEVEGGKSKQNVFAKFSSLS